jgi:Na+/melibiose symporter-like transporter
MRAPRRTRPALAATVAWLLVGALGIAMRERWAPPAALVALRGYGASDSTVALLLSTLPALASLLLVPAIGLRSDRSRARLGRRRPWLLVCAPLAGLAMLGAAAAPVLAAGTQALLGGAAPAMHSLETGWFCLCWALFDGAAACTAALFAGLVNDVVPRAFIGRFYALNRIVGLGVAIVFNMTLLARTDTCLRAILLAIALACALAIPLMCLRVREAPADAPAPPAAAPSPRALAHCLAQPGSAWAFAAFMLAAAAFGPFNTFSQNFALALGLSKAEFGALTAAGYAVSIAGAFAIGWLADRFDALRIAAGALALYVPLALAGSMLVVDAAAFRPFYLAHVILSGAFFTAAAAMPAALFPQAEFVRYNAGKDSLVAIASIVTGSAAGMLLDLSCHAYRLTLVGAALFSLACLGCLGRLLRQRSRAAIDVATTAPDAAPVTS